jgi:hypothetical protein
MCVLQDVLLPAERKQVELGEQNRVRESRVAFQAATRLDFIAVVEQVLYRKVQSFASAVDPDADVVYECFSFEQRESGGDGDGTQTPERAGGPGEDRYGEAASSATDR